MVAMVKLVSEDQQTFEVCEESIVLWMIYSARCEILVPLGALE